MNTTCLTNFSQAGGCGCKVDPSILKTILEGSVKAQDTNNKLLVGYETRDDCAVYEDSEDSYLLFTTDFFTPVVDSGYEYGWIAAANALSDIYSMGGHPILANAILGYPSDTLPVEVIREIVRGGSEAIAQVGCLLAGGHTINNPQPFYGFSIIGRVQKEHLKTNLGAKPGDVLILTKPLGAGIYTNAMKMGLLDDSMIAQTLPMLMEVNTVGAKLGKTPGIHALTDVTGFGLIGHALEMVDAQMHLTLFYDQIPFYEGTKELARATFSPKSGGMNNLHSSESRVRFPDKLETIQRSLLTDPQSNGGLLLAVDPEDKLAIISLLKNELQREVHEIGVFSEKENLEYSIEIKEDKNVVA